MCKKILSALLMLLCFALQSALAADGQGDLNTPPPPVSNLKTTELGKTDVLYVPANKDILSTKLLFNGIVMAGKRLISVGQYGTILYSDDKGKTWISATVPVSADLVAVHFPTPQKGWAVGHDGVVLHSTDAGATWVKQLDFRNVGELITKFYKEHKPMNVSGPANLDQFNADMSAFGLPMDVSPIKEFLDVYFENEKAGFLVGTFGIIFRTTDGGKTWEPWLDHVSDPLQHPHMYSVRSIDGDIYITGERGLLMRLDRKTSTFRPIKTPYEGTFFGIAGKGGAMAAYGMRGNVYRSTNKGASWKKIDTSVDSGLVGAAVTEDGRIIVVSQGGDVLLSSENGAAFDKVKMDKPFGAAAVASPDRNTIVIAGFGGHIVKKLK